MVKYCNADCQKSHFPEHKKFCVIFKDYAHGLDYFDDRNDKILESFMIEARYNQDYFAFERVVEVFNQEFIISPAKRDLYAGKVLYALAESYLNLGQNEKAIDAFEKEKESFQMLYLHGEKFALQLALKLNEIAKIRENPPPEAYEIGRILRGILSKSSQETHLQCAVSPPVMDTIQKYINLSFVEELQDECVSYMVDGFKDKGSFTNKRAILVALICIHVRSRVSQKEIAKYVGGENQDPYACECIIDVGEGYIRRHPEFEEIFIKYRYTGVIAELAETMFGPMGSTYVTVAGQYCEASKLAKLKEQFNNFKRK